jgi:hypothetical protein
MMKRFKAWVGNERGAVLFLVAASMIAMLGMAALAVDVGNLMLVRTESQRAADAAALAGAGWLITAPTDSAGARDRAIAYAAQNFVDQLPAVVQRQDIDVNLDSSLVRVRVLNTLDRGNPVPTVFARIFGVENIDIGTDAAAWAAPADELPPANVDCPLPIALPDKWIDTNGNRQWDPGESYDPEGTGFTEDDLGKLIVLKVSGSQDKGPKQCQEDAESPLVDLDLCRELPDSDNWRCWYQPEENAGGGTDVLGPQIYPADVCPGGLGIGDPVWAASGSGNKQSLVHTAHGDFGGSGPGSFADLVRSDPDLVWTDPDGEFGSEVGCVVDSRDPADSDGSPKCVENSKRIRKVPIVRPDAVQSTGSGVTTSVIDFTGVFIERVSCNYGLGDFGGPGGNWNVYVRLIRAPGGTSGGNGSDTGPTPNATTLKKLRLIE